MMRLCSLLFAFLVICEIRTGESASGGCNTNPCGNGAECQSMDNFAIVCVCPTGTVGDPFVACRPSPTTATSITSGSMSTSSHNNMVPASSSSSSSSSGTMMGSTSSSSSSSVPVTIHSQPVSSSSSVMTTATTMSGGGGVSLFPMDSSSNVRNDHTVVTKMSNMYNNPISYHPEKIYGSAASNSPDSSASSSPSIYRDDVTTTTTNNRHVIVHSSGLDHDNDGGHRHRVHHQDSNNNNNNNYGHNNMNFQHRNTENNNYSPYSPPSSPSYGENQNNNYIVKDPLGVYSNCKSINNVIVCADESDSDSTRHSVGQNSFQNDYSHRSSSYDDSNGRQKYSPHGSSSSGHRQEFGFSSNYDDSPKFSSNGGLVNNYNNHNDHNIPKPVPGDSETCKKYCGINAVCRTLLGRPICGCPEGTTGDPSMSCTPAEDQMKMTNRCDKHTECSETMICQEGQCLDPCQDNHHLPKTTTANEPTGLRNHFAHFHPTRGQRSMMMTCGVNAKCQVIRHTQLCGCLDGFSGNPYNGCVPSTTTSG